MARSRLSSSELRWRLDPAAVAQSDGHGLDANPEAGDPWPALIERLQLYLETALAGADSQRCHLFLRHAPGFDAKSLLERALARITIADTDREDYCFVHNFEHPDRPRLLRLPAGGARILQNELREISRFIRDELEGALHSRPIRNRLQALDDRSDVEMRRASARLEARLKPHGLVLMREQVGQLVRLTIHVQQTGRVITQDDLANLVANGQVSQEEFEQIRQVVRDSQPDLHELTARINEIWKKSRQLGQRLLRAETRRLLADLARDLFRALDDPEVRHHVDCVIADVLDKRVGHRTTHLADPELLYAANPIHIAGDGRLPVVRELRPTARNLGGTIDPSWLESGRAVASFRGIRGGSLLRAHGGFLIVEAGALLELPEAIRLLVNTLGSRHLSIEAIGSAAASPAIALKPDPVPIDTRLVLLGTVAEWQRLLQQHPDFARLLRPPVDLPDSIARDADGIAWLAGQLRRAGERLALPPISAEAIAVLVEHAARIGGPDRLSIHLTRLVDLLRDAGVLGRLEGENRITAVQVHRAIRLSRPRRRGNPGRGPSLQGFPARQHQLGQVYIGGLSADGELDYGQVLRVQAGLADSDALTVDFDGLDIDPTPAFTTLLATLLGQMLRPAAPIRAAIALRVECESESLRPGRQESLLLGSLAAILSRASGVPLRQDLMLLGNLDFEGRLLPVTAIDEQIEDAWHVASEVAEEIHAGVVIPALQRKALMLEPEVLRAVGNDLFQIHVAGNLVQVLELLIGTSPGVWREAGFPAGSMLARARERFAPAVADRNGA